MTVISQEVQQHWSAVSPLLSIRNEQEYDLAVDRLNHLLDEVGTNEQHPLYTLLDTLDTLLHAYEEYHSFKAVKARLERCPYWQC